MGSMKRSISRQFTQQFSLDTRRNNMRFSFGSQSSLDPIRRSIGGDEDDVLAMPENLDCTMQLLLMACRGDIKGMEDLLDEGIDVNSIDLDGRTASRYSSQARSAALYLKSTLGKEGVQELISNLSKDGGIESCVMLGLLLVLLCLGPSQSSDLDLADRASLLLFRSAVQDPDRRLSSWSSGSDCANWAGVSCSGVGGRVISLNLTDMNLSGDIGHGLCGLSLLESLELSRNRFSGWLPPCFETLYDLKILDLGYNQFVGALPDSWSRLGNLRELILTSNRDLGGALPFWIGNFSERLEKLDLSFNSFEGAVPASLLQLKSLRHLDCNSNKLSGDLPDFQQSLEFLHLGSNSFSGTLPCLWESSRQLRVLNLADNAIMGGIPSCLASLEALTLLNLSHNQLRYEVSPGLMFSERLIVLDLSFNELDGPLPSIIAKGAEKGLVLLDLSHNQFSGGIPSKITELKNLQALFLSHNLLTGEIPARIGNLTYLQVIDLSHNALSGPIPLNIVGCFQLLVLILNNNNLSGEIQPELDALNSLKLLDISSNMLSGEIPQTLAGCKSLEVVDLSSNNLSGSLNDAITKWSNLRYLSLAQNRFGGNVPSWIFSFDAIQKIDFSGNNFSGTIPDGNFNMSYFFNNSGTRGPHSNDQLLVADSDNRIKVIVAVADGNELKLDYDLNTFVGIDISGNMLHGVIPAGIFSLQKLEYLNLSYNFLSGQVPALEVMHSLVVLDLSHNSLSGQVPDNVLSLLNLTLFNLSYNRFSGLISKIQGYWRFPGAFAGNPKLCVETTGGECGKDSDPALPGETFEEEMIEGPISLWVFCLSAVITFYFSLISLFCSSRARRYILETKI